MRGDAIGGSGRQQPLTGVPVCVTWCQKGPCEYLQEGCWGWGAEAGGREGDTDTSQGALSWALCPGQHRDQGHHVAALQMATVPAATCRGQVGEHEAGGYRAPAFSAEACLHSGGPARSMVVPAFHS